MHRLFQKIIIFLQLKWKELTAFCKEHEENIARYTLVPLTWWMVGGILMVPDITLAKGIAPFGMFICEIFCGAILYGIALLIYWAVSSVVKAIAGVVLNEGWKALFAYIGLWILFATCGISLVIGAYFAGVAINKGLGVVIHNKGAEIVYAIGTMLLVCCVGILLLFIVAFIIQIGKFLRSNWRQAEKLLRQKEKQRKSRVAGGEAMQYKSSVQVLLKKKG